MATSTDITLLAEKIEQTLISPNESDSNGESANVVDGLFAISRSIRYLAKAIDGLGLNGADTGMGALENVAREIRDGLGGVAQSVKEHGGTDY